MTMLDAGMPRRAASKRREKAMLLVTCEECAWEFETTNPHHRLCPTCRPDPIRVKKPVRDCGHMTREQYVALIEEAKSKRPLPPADKGLFGGYGAYEGCNVTRSNGLMD